MEPIGSNRPVEFNTGTCTGMQLIKMVAQEDLNGQEER